VTYWQPISTAPKDGAWYLVGCWVQCLEDSVLEWSAWAEPLDGSEVGCDGRYGDPATHWMPLPAPPRDTIPGSERSIFIRINGNSAGTGTMADDLAHEWNEANKNQQPFWESKGNYCTIADSDGDDGA